MVNEVNLIDYLPPFIQEYIEIKNLMSAENPEFQLVEDLSEEIKDNQFIKTCDETGISMFEDMLGITASKEDTLESRISRVLMKWSEGDPYTYNVLISKLQNLCGEDNFVLVPDWNNYKVTIITHLNSFGQVDDLDKLLKDIFPCNIEVDCQNELVQKPIGTDFFSGPVATTKTIEIDTKTNTECIVTGTISKVNVVATTKHISI